MERCERSQTDAESGAEVAGAGMIDAGAGAVADAERALGERQDGHPLHCVLYAAEGGAAADAAGYAELLEPADCLFSLYYPNYPPSAKWPFC